MTVGELRKKLAKLPADMAVVTEGADHTLNSTWGISIHTVGKIPNTESYCMYGPYVQYSEKVDVVIIA